MKKLSVITLIAVLATATVQAVEPEGKSRPSVILILSDDHNQAANELLRRPLRWDSQDAQSQSLGWQGYAFQSHDGNHGHLFAVPRRSADRQACSGRRQDFWQSAKAETLDEFRYQIQNKRFTLVNNKELYNRSAT